MKKSELIKLISDEINDKSVDAGLRDRISQILEEFGRSSTKAERHPNIVEDGSVKVWCLKHKAYEDSGEFASVKNSPTGFHNKCRIADYQWRDFLKQIKSVSVDIENAISAGDIELASELLAKKKQLEERKDGDYEYPSDEELERIIPPKKKRGE